MKKKDKKEKPVNKTPELSKAKKALDTYLKENNLDPLKDWSKDKKHGKKVTQLLSKLNKERDKVAAEYPEKDLDNEKKLVKMKKKYEEEKEAKKKERKEKKEASERKAPTKYDYPLIDGREMTADEKKKYRMEQRKLAAGKTTKAKKEEKETKKVEKETSKEKKEKPSKKEKKAKDKKKAVKEED